MSKKNRMIFGVVTAEANSIEQREIIRGIVNKAQEFDIDIAVISNIYNPGSSEDGMILCENQIYELILSPDLDGIILISESFVNRELQQRIRDYLKQRDIPMLVIGSVLPELEIPGIQNINTSDMNDMEDITNHLIENHGFRDIALLTGSRDLSASALRIEGYRKSLEKHGIPFDDNKVYYGDFWMNSGKALALQYINGALPFPEALICANDYMAYGVMDTLTDYNIAIPETMAVIGYEYIRKRYLHTPILTTYQRNREETGRSAVQILYRKIVFGIHEEFIPPKGTLIHGDSCPCGSRIEQFNQELHSARVKADYDFWNLFGQMEQRLTECRNIDEFVSIAGSFHWQIRNVHNIYLCLLDNWYNASSAQLNDSLSCRSIMPWQDSKPFTIDKYLFSEIFEKNHAAAVYYFNPLFFSNRLFGYIVLQYGTPDTYDDIFRNWLKTISNGLEFLRIKNDIRYLTQCQNLSESRDSLTGFYNESGMEKHYYAALSGSENAFVQLSMLKTCLFGDELDTVVSKTAAISEMADAVKQFCGTDGICARIGEDIFICMTHKPEATDAMLTDKLQAFVMQHPAYLRTYGTDSFVCCTVSCSRDTAYSDAIALCRNQTDALAAEIAQRRNQLNYDIMLQIRNAIYADPKTPHDTEDVCQQYSYSPGYLRALYKKSFVVSFYKDCIHQKITKAKYLLCTTNLNITQIAKQCGYDDSKYFLRQFLSATGITPHQYRLKMA
ncbi:MAG: substrate-binding domain-containing protein [Oscillospiraceae bacterium]